MAFGRGNSFEKSREPAMPPPGLEGERLAEWWRRRLKEEGPVELPREGDPWLCGCGALNPCTAKFCYQCNVEFAEGFKERVKSDLHNSGNQRGSEDSEWRRWEGRDD